jgi:hypothetical protein
VILRLAMMATAKSDCAAVRNTSSFCSKSKWRASICPAPIEYTSPSVPISSVHWFTFDEMSVPIPAWALRRKVNRMAMIISGASDARGATHWIRRKVLMPKLSPIWMRPSAKCSATKRMAAAA